MVYVDAATLPWLEALRDGLYDECDALDRAGTDSPIVVPHRGRDPAPRSFLSPDSTTSSAGSDYFGNSPRSSDSNATSPSQSLVGLSSLAPAGASGFGLAHDAPRFVLCDLSNAVHKHSSDKWPIVQSRHFRAPEVIMGLDWAERIDVWSLACLVCRALSTQS